MKLINLFITHVAIFAVLIFGLTPNLALASSTITTTNSTNVEDTFGFTTGQQYAAQSFTTTQSGTISSIATSLQTVGSPSDNVTVSLQADSAGAPSGVSLGSGTVAAASVPSACSSGRTTFTFSGPVTVTNSTLYWVVYSRSGANDTSNRYQICGNDTSSYATGNPAEASNLFVWTNFTWEDNITLTINDPVVVVRPTFFYSYWLD